MITVVMAAYNAEAFLEEAVQSILGQTYPKLELIVVDDGSTDRTREILDEFARHDSRLRVLTMPHVGQTHARNAGAEAGKYPWLAIMDADDIALPQRLQRQLETAESDPEVVLWGAYLTRITEEGTVIDTIKFGPNSKEDFYKMNRAKTTFDFFNGTLFCRRDLFLEIGGYNTHIQYHTDSELCDRMADRGPIVILPEPLLLYRQHENNETMKLADIQEVYYKYVSARYRARLKGQTLTIEEYLDYHRKRPFWQHIASALRTMSLNYATNSLMAFARKQYLRGVMLALAATLANPFRAVKKLRVMIAGDGLVHPRNS